MPPALGGRTIRGSLAELSANDEHGPAGVRARRVHGGGQLLDERRRRRVDDGVHGVEPQPVDVEVLDPPAGALDERAADEVAARPGDVDGVAPRRPVGVGEVRGEAAVGAALRAEVVVDDVEHDAEPGGVGGVDEAGEPVGPAVRLLHRRREHAVVAPVADAGEGVDRHQLDRRDAEPGEPVELAGDAVERALGRERADVQLVQHGVGEGDAAPVARRSSGTSPGRRRPTGRARRRAASPTPGRRAARRRRAGSGTDRRARPRRRRRPTSRRPRRVTTDAPAIVERRSTTDPARGAHTSKRVDPSPTGWAPSLTASARRVRGSTRRSRTPMAEHSDGSLGSIWAMAARGQETQAGRTVSS